MEYSHRKLRASRKRLQSIDRIFSSIGFRPFAPAPENINLRAEFCAQVHRRHGFLNGVRADRRIPAGERPILEDWIAKKVGGGHRHFQIIAVDALFEVGNDR